MAHAFGKRYQAGNDQGVRQGRDFFGQSRKKIGPQEKKPLVVPPELKQALAKNAKARKGFHALRLGLQREYTDHVASAKREETKQKRIEKILPMFVVGKGLHDKYR
jgi:uncharacterized protein YdeI (YjbR/CyaY-like superfamily)